MSQNRRNEYVAAEENIIQQSPDYAMQQFKHEVAAELGLVGYDRMDKGWLASRQNGYVGGNMTKKMVAYAEQAIAQQGVQNIVTATHQVLEVSPEVARLNQLASQNFTGYVQAIQGLMSGQTQGQGQQLQ